MRKRIGLIFVVLLIALLTAALVACDPDPTNPLGPEDPSQSTYTVTFDLNGALFEFPEELAPITGVKYGDTIAEPLDKDGKRIELQKEGYEFKGWTANNDDFVFGEGGTKIVSNTTIRAKFVAKKYYHIPDIYTTVTYEGGKYVLNENGHAKTYDNGDPIPSNNVLTDSLGEEVKDGKGNTISVPDTDITFAENAIGPNTTLYSTYNATAPSRMAVPSRPALDGEEKDNFCFWYYMTDTLDEDGNPVTEDGNPNGKVLQHPVQFSEWASKGATDVAVREITYTYDNPLTLYAMFESDLPFVTVEYYESETSEEPLNKTEIENGEFKYRLGEKIPESEEFFPLPTQTSAHQTDYDFNYWYFVYLTENEEEGEEKVRNVQKFVFETFDENGNSLNKDSVTSPMDAAHDENIPAVEQNFRPVTLKLYANWVKMITINNAEDYNAKLATPIGELFAKIAALKDGETLSEEDQKDLDEFLTATIKFADSIDFGGKTLTPLFDADHPFAGMIDGGKYTADAEDKQTLDGKNTLSNIKIEGESHASLFGYVDGIIKNLNVEQISIKATGDDNVLYLGALASVSRGSFSNCVIKDVTFSLPAENAGLAYIGGLAGQFSGTANVSDKGSIKECSVTLSLSGLSAKGLYIGGIVGDSGSSTVISNCTAALTIASSVVATERQGAYSGLKIGGIAGNSVADLSACEATLTVNENAITAKGTALIGGLLGQNAGSVSRSHAIFTAPSLSLGSIAPLQSLAVGGLIGLNEGDIINSYSDVNIALTVIADQRAQIGGLVGGNNSARADSQSDKEKGPGAINRCYSTGKITVNVDEAVTSATLYVGGMIGFSRHSKFANNFTLTNLDINYNTTDNSLIHAGFLFGSLDKSATIASGYYSTENEIKINGKAEYGINYVQDDPKDEDGSSDTSDSSDEEETPEEGGIFSLGTPRDKADFSNKEIVFGTNSDDVNDRLGWAGGNEDSSKNIWKLNDEDPYALPTLVGIGFPQESQEG